MSTLEGGRVIYGAPLTMEYRISGWLRVTWITLNIKY
jgi:hypothetical protein